ncbi:beta-lactamase/transpeptidase-like protein [Stipitochalara longipes BDJ]|nr:beta-lactamase/transpeptidase-like protein [Stipitochalara longipes BDJ]
MEAFEEALAVGTQKAGASKVAHGIIVAAIDSSGEYIYQNTAGYMSVQPGALPIKFNNALVMASCTKLVTTIAALQCVDRGLITLDEPIGKHLPELSNPQVITYDTASEKGPSAFKLNPAKSEITLRQLLNHTSGLGYDLGEPVLEAWRESRGETPLSLSARVVDAFSTPLLFEPGTKWVYGAGIDWAGLLICRLTERISLENYLIDNVFEPLGMTSTTFHLWFKPEIIPRFVQPAYRLPDGSLIPGILPYPHPPADEYGGNGLLSCVPDYMRILHDIISPTPVLLKPETVALLFEPQFAQGSGSMSNLYMHQELFENSAGGHIGDLKINYGLSALLMMEDVPRTGAKKGTLAWGGLPNLMWWANREHGVAGMYATQVIPHSDKKNTELFALFQRSIWKMIEK